ncbi:hypothetical protein, partial [Pseudoalteromonas sp. APC 3694]|uniref:hypothetical protein n=1 Tax=Pseudoalteromonas sp. APC 3694 TaxID=3035202 RepID=UPI0025B61BDA
MAFLFPLKAQRLLISAVYKLLKNYLNTEKTTGFERRGASFTNCLISALNLEPTLLAQRLFALFVNNLLNP